MIKLDIFLSWSGGRSKFIGGILKKWLPRIIQNINVLYSTKDIPKGKVWFEYIREALEKCNLGIVILTPENVESKWVLFEAGAVQKKTSESTVYTLLYDLEPKDVDYPLAGFQHTVFEKKDFKTLVNDINKKLAENALQPADLDYHFESV